MTVLRLAMFLVLTAALLPWGAFAQRFEADPAVVQAEVTAPDEIGADPEFRAVRRCRGPAVLGSACGPDLIQPRLSLVLPVAVATGLLRRDGGVRLPGLHPPTALDPPIASTILAA